MLYCVIILPKFDYVLSIPSKRLIIFKCLIIIENWNRPYMKNIQDQKYEKIIYR